MPRFVILEHTWNGTHHDLILERPDQELLRTWAIDSDHLPEQGEEAPARRLADHRRIYLEYEGPISGDRGSVRRVDAGTYEEVAWEEDRVVLDLEGSQLRGRVELSRRETGRVGRLTSNEAGWLFRWLRKVD